MPDSLPVENDFISQLTAIVEKNISNEQFGVSELADEMSMSRSNLLRKVKKETNLSVSQLISQVRLKRGMDLLHKSSLNVSEVSHQVGFASTSYFIKCFREYYGYPPGEVGKKNDAKTSVDATEISVNTTTPTTSKSKRSFLIGFLALIIALGIGSLIYYYAQSSSKTAPLEKSIAVLPFKNDSNDSTNLYLINGLMESTLNNLQKMKDLKVLSRTSSEKYRNTSMSIPEMAKELNVSYFVEGSGQKLGDRIFLNIQLIEASSDKHLWAKQYVREAKDIFELQKEIAKNIADEIQVIISPELQKIIEKNPTDNLEAYDLFLKGREIFYRGSRQDLEASISFFQKAVERDPKFALAYAEMARVYYYLDVFQTEKKYAEEINNCADKALLYDPKLTESLVAKALFYLIKQDYELAVPYLEKALEYNPNSIAVINFLSEIYNVHIPNSYKYLENALMGVRLNVAAHDSVTTSYIYLHLANALIQNGFVDQAIASMNRSLAYNPQNPFAYAQVLFEFAKSRDVKGTKDILVKEFNRDTTRFHIAKEIGKLCSAMEDYKESYKYYKKFDDLRKAMELDIFQNEDLGIAYTCAKLGLKDEAAEFIKSFKTFADSDKTIYRHFHQAMYYMYLSDSKKTIEELKLFSKEDNYQYWILLINIDPSIDSMKDLPEFKKVMNDIEAKFWRTNKATEAKLAEKGLLLNEE
jgi:TolB-like protein/AraC-like DNA-binding protein/Tfp pilus assembly protein PilF